jgi:hypothetical protein
MEYKEIKNKKVKAEKKFKIEIITGIVAGCKVHREFVKSLEKYAKLKNANIVFMAMKHHAQPFESPRRDYDKFVENYQLIKHYRFNENLIAIDAQINPQQLSPLTGLYRYGNGLQKTSVIIAHPKQDLKVIATGIKLHPRIITTTGVCTYPSYVKNRIGLLASQQHKIGAIIVEKRSDKIFHLRHITANKDGSFIDLGVLYSHENKPVRVDCKMVLGDDHGIEISSSARIATQEQIDELKPNEIFINDGFDGKSVNVHTVNQFITQFMTHKNTPLTVEKEVCDTLKIKKEMFGNKKLVWVPSNHPDWIDRMLEVGSYPRDPLNSLFMHKLAIMKMEDPESNTILNAFKLVDPKFNMNITFPKRTEDIWAYKTQIHHGDIGLGGAKGSLSSFSKFIGSSTIAHSHTPGIDGDSMQVGHLTHGEQSYLKGLNSWIFANGVIYPNNNKQLIMIIPDGKKVYWRL